MAASIAAATTPAGAGLRATARMAVGVAWLIDAVLKWLPAFRPEVLSMVQDASKGQPAWLGGWFNFWIWVISGHQALFATLVALGETVLGLAIVLGFARKTAYMLSGALGLIIWATAEGFGGPYTPGATDIGAAII